jgi:hypothetical protein
MREAATRNDQNRGAFNQDEQVKDLVVTLDEWQKSGDQRLFKFIISPEFSDRLNLEQLTRDLMTRMERDLSDASRVGSCFLSSLTARRNATGRVLEGSFTSIVCGVSVMSALLDDGVSVSPNARSRFSPHRPVGKSAET